MVSRTGSGGGGGCKMMPAFISPFFFLFFVLVVVQSTAAAAVLHDYAVVAPPPPPQPRGVDLVVPSSSLGNSVDLYGRSSTHSGTIPLDWSVLDKQIFSKQWDIGNRNSASLTVSCNECTTTGSVVVSATLPDLSDIGDIFDDLDIFDIFDKVSLVLAFERVRAYVDLNVVAQASGNFSLPLFQSQSPIGIAAGDFSLGVVFSVNLVVGLEGEIDTTGGFQVYIPDGSIFTVLLDDEKEGEARFDGAHAYLIPMAVEANAKVTLALQLKVQAGIELPDNKIFDATALVGAFVNVPEVHLSETAVLLDDTGSSSDATCLKSATAEFNVGAGAFVDVGAHLGKLTAPEFNPTATTTFFAASSSTCFASATPSSSSTTTSHSTTMVTTTPGNNGTATATSKPSSSGSVHSMKPSIVSVSTSWSNATTIAAQATAVAAGGLRGPRLPVLLGGGGGGGVVELTPLPAPVTRLALAPLDLSPGTSGTASSHSSVITGVPIAA